MTLICNSCTKVEKHIGYNAPLEAGWLSVWFLKSFSETTNINQQVQPLQSASTDHPPLNSPAPPHCPCSITGLSPDFSYLPQRSCSGLLRNELTSNVFLPLPPAGSHCKKWLAGYGSWTMSNMPKWPLPTTATRCWLDRLAAVVSENWSVYGYPLMSRLSPGRVCHHKGTLNLSGESLIYQHLSDILNCNNVYIQKQPQKLFFTEESHRLIIIWLIF